MIPRMTAELAAHELMSVADYLEWEAAEEVRHEYVGGVVYEMAGGTLPHAAIGTNIVGILHRFLRGKSCRPFGPDLKVCIEYPTHTRLYYPDAMVVCQPGSPGEHFHRHPSLIVEVLSESTRRTDESEKREAYFTIESLRVYILLEQDEAAAVVWRRRDEGFVREVYLGLDAVIELPEFIATLPLAEVYEAVEFPSPNSKG